MALSLSQGRGIFLATAEARDEEMKERIQRHRNERDACWITIEEPVHLDQVLDQYPKETIVIDCLTLWLSNLLEQSLDPPEIAAKAEVLLKAAKKRTGCTIIVTNELGQGIVPVDASVRKFRDLCGTLNQQFSAAADCVIFMVSGLPLYLK